MARSCARRISPRTSSMPAFAFEFCTVGTMLTNATATRIKMIITTTESSTIEKPLMAALLPGARSGRGDRFDMESFQIALFSVGREDDRAGEELAKLGATWLPGRH